MAMLAVRTILVVALVARTLVDADIRITSPTTSPFYGASSPDTTYTLFMGPQYGDALAYPRHGPVYLYSGNPCIESSLPTDMGGKIVVLQPTQFPGCSLAYIYNNFLKRNVSVLVQVFFFGPMSNPGQNYYSLFGLEDELNTRAGSMPFLQATDIAAASGITYSQYLTGPQITNLTMSITIDQCVYKSMFDGWLFQLVVRWIPCFTFFFIAISSIAFLLIHFGQIVLKYQERVSSAQARTWERHMNNMVVSFSLPHLTLFLESGTSFVLGFTIGLYGMQSVPHPYFYVAYFNTILTGWGFMCDILSAKFWDKMFRQLPQNAAVKDRGVAWMLNHRCLGPFIMIIPLAIDTTLSAIFSLNMSSPSFLALLILVLILLQLTVGIHFMLLSRRFLLQIRESLKNTTANKPRPSDLSGGAHSAKPGLNSRELFLIRMTRWQFFLGFCMVVYVLSQGIAMTPYQAATGGYFAYFAIGWNIRALSSLARVMMNRPRLPETGLLHFTKNILAGNTLRREDLISVNHNTTNNAQSRIGPKTPLQP